MKPVSPCRGCTEEGWQGLIDVQRNQFLHERSVVPGETEVLACTNPNRRASK